MKIKQNYLLLLSFIAILLFMNVQIFQKEAIKTNGETIYFELVPVDPRAFMLGDYMALNFKHNLRNHSDENIQMFIVTLDDRNIVIDAKYYKGETLIKNQRLFKIQDKLRPDRFYFQEGHADAYATAKYGAFRYISHDQFLLNDMMDNNLQAINLI